MTDKQKMYRHLNYSDRKKIESMRQSRYKVADIAKALGVSKYTVYSELKRGGLSGYYSANLGQQVSDDIGKQAIAIRRQLGRKKKKRIQYTDRINIEYALKDGKSVEEIAEEVGVSTNTILLELKRCPKGAYSALEAQKTYGIGGLMGYKDRVVLKKMITAHPRVTVKELAVMMGVSETLMRNELRRGGGDPLIEHYDPVTAQIML